MRDSSSRHLREQLHGTEPHTNGSEAESGLPEQADGEYSAFPPPANKPQVSLHFITPDGRVRTFQYRHLDSDTSFEPEKITLRFLGFRPIMVVIEGQHLWQLYDNIHRDLCRWVRQAPREFAEEGQPIVRKFTFVDLTEVVS